MSERVTLINVGLGKLSSILSLASPEFFDRLRWMNNQRVPKFVFRIVSVNTIPIDTCRTNKREESNYKWKCGIKKRFPRGVDSFVSKGAFEKKIWL